MANITKLPVTIIRGGTSKGVYILEDDLPADKAAWEPLLLRLMGSPDKKQIDLLSHMMSMQKTHPSYAMTGAMCTAAAAVVPGSIVNQVLPKDVDTQFIRIGHPAGILECGVDFTENGACPEIADTFGFRTANLIMEGVATMALSSSAAGALSELFHPAGAGGPRAGSPALAMLPAETVL